MESRPDEFVLVLSTAPDEVVARGLSRDLVERRLAACVNIVRGLVSIYRWEGAVQEDAEVLLVIKTRAALFDALSAAIASLHPYAVPEVIALPVQAGRPQYLSWLAEATSEPTE